MKYFETKKDSLEEAISKAINEKKLDAVGKEDGDIDNDGDKDASDKYLAKRRKAISKAIKKDQKEESDMVERKVTATVNDLTDRKFQKAQLMKDLRADAKKMSRDAFVKKNSYRVKPDALAVMWNALNEENELDESKMGELFLDMQMDAQEMDEREFIKVYTKKGFQAAELKSLYKEFSEEVVKEVVDNSLMAQAPRVISQTSIKEKIDPADIDNIATADDRKAADKNIIIQLRRAQDMQGKADVTFKDKPNKKEKLDIRVINKALDMFDKMKPNDKAKMQTTIGKSYRDLLKTVQRGRV